MMLRAESCCTRPFRPGSRRPTLTNHPTRSIPLASASRICAVPRATHSSGVALSTPGPPLAVPTDGRSCASNTSSLSVENTQSAGLGVGSDVMAMSSGRMIEWVKWSMFYGQESAAVRVYFICGLDVQGRSCRSRRGLREYDGDIRHVGVLEVMGNTHSRFPLRPRGSRRR